MMTIPRGIHSTHQHEPLPPEEEVYGEEQHAPDPESPTLIEAEIVAVMAQQADRPVDHVARRILKIDRIARGLKLLDDIDAGAVELISYGSKPESSDAR